MLADPPDAALRPGPIEFPPFRQRWPWIGPDLQSAAYEVVSRGIDLGRWPDRRVEVEVGDGSGDRLVHHLHLPEPRAGRGPGRPVVVMVHGLGGSADAGYVSLAAADLLGRGYPVLRYNRRGCGAGADAAAGCAWHGDTAGLGATARALRDRRGELGLSRAGLAMIGFSLGGNALVQWLADDAGDLCRTLPVLAAATVSAPIDLAASARRLDSWRNLHYRPYIVAKLRNELLRPAADLTDAERRALGRALGMWDVTEKFNAPRNGFDSAQSYYDAGHLGERVARVGIPLLMIHSRDDPWVPHDAYERVDWEASSNLLPLFTDRGGHMGFQGLHGPTPWSIHCITRFFEAAAARAEH